VCFLWTSFSQMHFSQTHFPEYIFPKKISSVCPWLFNRIILPNGNGQFVFLLSKNWRQKITGCQKYIKIIGNIHSKDRLHNALSPWLHLWKISEMSYEDPLERKAFQRHHICNPQALTAIVILIWIVTLTVLILQLSFKTRSVATCLETNCTNFQLSIKLGWQAKGFHWHPIFKPRAFSIASLL